jgi:hypothetical protein
MIVILPYFSLPSVIPANGSAPFLFVKTVEGRLKSLATKRLSRLKDHDTTQTFNTGAVSVCDQGPML